MAEQGSDLIKKVFLFITSIILLLSCGGRAIQTAQDYSTNKAPLLNSLTVTNTDGSEINKSRIEPYSTFAVLVAATDPDADYLNYAFSSSAGSIKNIVPGDSGCTAQLVIGNISGGQSVSVSVTVSDGRGASARVSYDVGKGKIGPTVTVTASPTRITPSDIVTLNVSANCAGVFQIKPNGNGTIVESSATIDYLSDMMIFTDSGTPTKAVLTGPASTSPGNIQLGNEKSPYANGTVYNVIVVFRDGLNQTDAVTCPIIIDGEKPYVSTSTAGGVSGSGIETDVPVAPVFSFIFDEQMDESSFSGAAVSIAGNGASGSVSFLAYNTTSRTADFKAGGLTRNCVYTASLTGAKDLAGNLMTSSSLSFQTASSSIVSYYANGADSGSVPATAKYAYGQSVTVSDNTGNIVKNGYDFGGWKHSTNGNTYTIGAAFLMGEDDVILSAAWIPVVVTGLSLNRSSIGFAAASGSCTLTATAVPTNAPDKSVTWTSSNTSVAAVDANGTVTAVGSGTATVTATSNSNPSKFASCAVSVSSSTPSSDIALKALSTTSSSITPKWTFTADAYLDSFSVEIVPTDGGTTSTTKVALSTSPYNFTINGLTLLTDYTITISPCDAGGNAYGNSLTLYVTPMSADKSYTLIASLSDLTSKVGTDLSGTYILTADITNSGSTMIGSSSYFQGVFNGNGHTISGINISVSNGAVYAGLFPYINGAFIQNLTLDGTVSCQDTTSSASYAGILSGQISNAMVSRVHIFGSGNVTKAGANAGAIAGAITNSSIEHSTNSISVTGTSTVGGLIGKASGSLSLIKNCTSSGAVSGLSNIGGLIGYADNTTITGCSSTGLVSGDYTIGGFVGYMCNVSKISSCTSSGVLNQLNTAPGNCIGGFVGQVSADGSTITLSSATGAVNGYPGTSVNYVGGFVGSNSGSITQCFAKGNVNTSITDTNYAPQYVGGFAGVNYGTISNCYSRGIVKGYYSIGGFIGQTANTSTIVNCYVNSVSVLGSQNFSPFVGYNIVSASHSFYCAASSAPSPNVAGITAAQMQTISTFTGVGWDFLLVWTIDSSLNDGYPYLKGTTP